MKLNFNWIIFNLMADYTYIFKKLKISTRIKFNSKIDMYQEENIKYPQLLCPQYHDPITMVTEDNKDIMNSRLLCSRSIAIEYKELFSQNRQSLVVVDDILKEATKPSPIISVNDPASLETLRILPQLIKDFGQKQKEEERNLQAQQEQILQQLKQKVNDLGSLLTQSASLVQQKQVIVDSGVKLQHAVQNDPLATANIPKPSEALERIEELKASTDLPQYLFGLVQSKRAWQQHATPQLLQWKIEKEQFYRDRLYESLNQTQKNSTLELAIAFFNQQFDQIASQVQQIIQEEDNQNQTQFLELKLDTAESLALVTNEMLTPETKLVYKITGDFSGPEGLLVQNSFKKLTQLLNLEIQFNTQSKHTQGLSEIARVEGLNSMQHIRTLTFKTLNSSLTNEHIKQFFGELVKNDNFFPNLQELTFEFTASHVSKEAAQQVIKAIHQLGSHTVRTLSLNFSRSNLSHEFGFSLAEALKPFKGLRSLKLDLGGFSLGTNELKDKGFLNIRFINKGFISIIQVLDTFADNLSQLEINVSRNGLTDQSLVAFYQTIRSAKWPKLKDLNLVLQKNAITERGVKKLAKSIQSLPILLKFQLNLGSNYQIDLRSVKQLIQQLPPYLQLQKINVRGSGLDEQEVQEYILSNKLQSKLLI